MSGDNNGSTDLMAQIDALPDNRTIAEIPKAELVRRGMFWALAPVYEPDEDADD